MVADKCSKTRITEEAISRRRVSLRYQVLTSHPCRDLTCHAAEMLADVTKKRDMNYRRPDNRALPLSWQWALNYHPLVQPSCQVSIVYYNGAA